MVANHILLRIAVLPAQPSISTSPALHICVISFQEKIKHKQSHNPYCPAVITVVLVNNVINQQMHIRSQTFLGTVDQDLLYCLHAAVPSPAVSSSRVMIISPSVFML